MFDHCWMLLSWLWRVAGVMFVYEQYSFKSSAKSLTVVEGSIWSVISFMNRLKKRAEHTPLRHAACDLTGFRCAGIDSDVLASPRLAPSSLQHAYVIQIFILKTVVMHAVFTFLEWLTFHYWTPGDRRINVGWIDVFGMINSFLPSPFGPFNY